MRRKHKKLASIGFVAVILTIAIGLILTALRDQIVFFYAPSEIVLENKVVPGQRFRLGGLVKDKSVRRQGVVISFVITDTNTDLTVKYSGILPGLFREGQGVVAEGKLDKSFVFIADSILAKHDESYMPREVADSLGKQGYWKDTKQEKGKAKSYDR